MANTSYQNKKAVSRGEALSIGKTNNIKEIRQLTVSEVFQKIWDEYAKVNDSLFATPVQKEIVKIFQNSLLPCPGGIVHDGGCGIGYYLKIILEKTQASKIIATDFSSEMLNKAKENVLKLAKEDQEKIEFRQMDLSKDWPKEMFDAQTFQFLANYFLDNGWQRIIEMTYKTLKNNGYIYSSILLKDFTVEEMRRKQLLKQIFYIPIFSFYKLSKLSKILCVYDDLVEKGKINYPTREEYLEYHKKVGFRNIEVVGEMYWGKGILVRAQK